jgi:nicotinamidase/pyrazinamidase
MSTLLLIIDAQNDFCDLADAADFRPALAVPGADQDCVRLAQFISRAGKQIDTICATLDSHHIIDLAHALCWHHADGNAVQPFSCLTSADLHTGHIRPAAELNPATFAAFLADLQQLESLGRNFMLWPTHCLIGSRGHNLHAAVAQALQDWELLHFKPVQYVNKGENMRSEHFSAISAVVPCPDDPASAVNYALLNTLAQADCILVAGQAASHCVKETVNDILRFADTNIADKLVLLTDCMSPVAGFEDATASFFKSVQAQGACLSSSTAILPALLNGGFLLKPGHSGIANCFLDPLTPPSPGGRGGKT